MTIKLKMEYQILIAISLAISVALISPATALNFEFLGTVYLKLLKFVIAPLLFFSIVSAIVGLGNIKEMGRLGGITLSIYMSTTVFAIIVSLIVMNIFTPGVGVDLGDFEKFNPSTVQELSFSSFLLSVVPSNAISPFLESNAMQLVFISFLIGAATLSLSDKESIKRVFQNTEDISQIILKFTSWIIVLTPIGIFGLIGAMVAKSGIDSILNLWKFVVVILLGLSIHKFIILPMIAKKLGKFNPYKYIFKLKEVVLFAFSTASSSATLPLNLSKSVEIGGVSKKIANLVLPIGATVNMDGTALYQAAVAIFVAQALGIELTLIQQLTIAFIVVVASVGAAGIPGAGIVLLTTVFATIGLPIEAIGAIMVVDRFLDMFRTAVNVTGDIYVTKIVDNIYKKDLEKEIIK